MQTATAALKQARQKLQAAEDEVKRGNETIARDEAQIAADLRSKKEAEEAASKMVKALAVLRRRRKEDTALMEKHEDNLTHELKEALTAEDLAKTREQHEKEKALKEKKEHVLIYGPFFIPFLSFSERALNGP